MDKKNMKNLLVGYFVFEKIKKAMNTGLGIIIAVIMWFIVLFILSSLGIGHM